MRFPGRPVRFFLIVLIALASGGAGRAEEVARTTITVGGRAFRVELAVTPERRARGLMFRTELAADAGMLFDFGGDRFVSMWMKNTFLPLDMLFITDAGTVARIAKRTVPHSTQAISSRGRVRYVLELNGGTADRLGLKAGDAVTGLPRRTRPAMR